MKKVYCDICNKEITEPYSKFTVKDREHLDFCYDCTFNMLRYARNLRIQDKNNKTGDEDS